MKGTLASCLGILLLFVLSGCKKEVAPTSSVPARPVAAPPPSAPSPSAVAPTLPSAPTIDPKLLLGTWNSKDNPGVSWKFNADGTKLIKTAYTEIPGTYRVNGATLTLQGKDVPEGRYTIVELGANKLVLRDENHGGIQDEFTRQAMGRKAQ
jgi:hypothetical protein